MPAYNQKVSASVASLLYRESLAQSQRGCMLSTHFSGLSMRKKECKVELLPNHIHVYEITVFMQVCEYFKMCAHGHVRRSTVPSGRQAGITPNLLITHLWKIAPPPIVLHEPCPLTAAKNSMSILKELKCALCSNIFSQPLELACSPLVCTKCIVDMIAASGSVNCPFCSDDGPLVPSHIRPASNAIHLLLSDVLAHCTICGWDVKAVEYDAHECVPLLTPGEERQAAKLLKRAVSCSPETGAIQLVQD